MADERTCVRRHLGTDALVGGWLFVVGSIVYLAFSALVVADERNDHVDHAPRLASAWCNLAAAVLFLLGSCYFVKLSYPEAMTRFHADALSADLEALPLLRRYVTFNEFMIATWFFFWAMSLYDVVGVFWWVYGAPTVAAFFFVGTTVVQLALLLWIYSGCPDAIQANGGRGSSVGYDALCCGADSDALRSRFGTDAQLGAWIFFVGCVGAFAFCAVSVILAPTDASAWLMAASMGPFAAGSWLYVRAAGPGGEAASLLFGDGLGDGLLASKTYGAAGATTLS
jgi:hypothetical protein